MKKESKSGSMKEIKLGKVVVNIGLKESGEPVERAYIFVEKLTGKKPVKTISSQRARTFRLRKGLPIGVKVTLRDTEAIQFLKKVLPAVENKVRESSFDNEGNFGFGIKEHLDIPGQKYDPKLGVFGLNVNAALIRSGFRVKTRKIRKSHVGKAHRISKTEAVNFVKNSLGLKVV
ncbi:MAG: 50S ribosomal protein L5 [Nanoarchaeota archaeon]|nr:50S ribosomal protein L5 [Nanoarchaeota archaeon]MBU4300775.1 50S ribosomal protein L5 [Nanoarchaeota archaeon]MBU4452357.1 50S ribosomal protein L5 [Nanoarchaeota archaeon]MCG2723367.1 50S ribosomal protein L5 [archaeon]